MTATVLLVDDQALLRAGFRMVLEEEPDISIVGEAADGNEAVRLSTLLRPDVVLMDVRMPGMDGIEATRRIVEQVPRSRVLILTTFDLDEYAFNALRLGASGFLLKDVPPAELARAIRTIADGDAVVSPRVTRKLLDTFAPRLPDLRQDAQADEDARLAALTEREQEILVEVASGRSNTEIAAKLFVAEATVKTHVGRVLAKLGLRDRVQAVVYAFQTGLVRASRGRLIMLLATIAALGAAVLFAITTALQHRSAGLVNDAGAATDGLTTFIAGSVRHPLWVAGAVADLGGFGLHALALHEGPLALVQPLLVTSVVFALALRQLLEHRRPRRDELAWASALGVGLVLFLTVSTPATGVTTAADPVPTVVLGSLIGVAIVVLFLLGHHRSGPVAAALLGAAAGLSHAAAAGLLKDDVGIVDRGISALLVAWPLYLLIAVGAASLVLTQLAYRAGPLTSSLPAVMTIDPVVSVIIGIAVFDESFRSGPAALVAEAVGLALVVAAAVGLTRSGEVVPPTGPVPDRPPAVTCPPPHTEHPSTAGADRA